MQCQIASSSDAGESDRGAFAAVRLTPQRHARAKEKANLRQRLNDEATIDSERKNDMLGSLRWMALGREVLQRFHVVA